MMNIKLAEYKERRRHERRLVCGYLLNLFDLFCTLYWVNRYGVGIEGNPFGAAMLNDFLFAVLYKVVLIGALLLFLHRNADKPISRIGSSLILAVYGVLAAYHIIIFTAVAMI